MKKLRQRLVVLFGFLVLIATIQPVAAANQYSVCVGAQFKWDATKYIFQDGFPDINDVYSLEFQFTNFASTLGLEYLNGTINNNGTILNGELSHAYYYSMQQVGQEWVTSIIDTGGNYKVYVYLICEVEIEQTTKPNLQSLASNTWIDMTETSTNNFTLSGTDVAGSNHYEYIGKIEFNSDKVLKHLYDELRYYEGATLKRVDRYEWTLTSYTKGTGTCGGGSGNGGIPGFPVYLTVAAIVVGLVVIIRKRTFTANDNYG